MNFSSMEYFAVLAQERSFTRAAERLHITQQSLSAHIANLEQELGCQLVVRRVPLDLTYAGTVLLRYADGFQRSRTAMLREFGDISRNQRGVLRVGVAAMRGRVLLPKVIARFQRGYPNIALELSEGSNHALHQMLLKGALDLAIADFPGPAPDIALEDFYQEEVVLLIHRTLFRAVYGESAEDVDRRFGEGDFSALAACPLVLGTEDDIDGQISHDVLRRSGIAEPVVRAVSHNAGMLLALCVRGIGACFCPENLARETLPEDALGALKRYRLGDGAKYAVRFGSRGQSYQWSVIRAFMEAARACCGQTEASQ